MKKILITASLVVFLAGLLPGQAQPQIPCDQSVFPICDGDCPPGLICVQEPAGAPICVCEPELIELDFGDAPEGVLAYSTGIIGSFPTCTQVGPPLSWIQHTNFGGWFGTPPGLQGQWDPETDGNAGFCTPPTGFPPYDLDECFGPGIDPDAGLLFPPAYTIVGGIEQPCVPGAQGALGITCQQAVWGVNVDIDVHNWMPNHDPYVPAYVNVLIDFSQDGDWLDTPVCPPAGTSAPEHVLVDFVVPPQYDGPLSALMPPGTGFLIGPNPGYVWARFSLTDVPITPPPWDGSGMFEDGETEDYLLLIDPDQQPTILPVLTECPVVDTECPVDLTICEITECPAIETECPTVFTRCPVVPTECPVIETHCPVDPTFCPIIDTQCPEQGPTICPEIATECPVIPTECPMIYTECPEWGDTYCPAMETVCPKIETICANEYTYCPEEPTVCPYFFTECPMDDPTFCPMTQTQCELTICELIPTFCPEEPTVCPTFGTFTVCPFNYTWCPGDIPTECPLELTFCPETPTVCPTDPVATVCPEIATECPVIQTICPTVADPTVCPINPTYCPIDSTVCPTSPTLCPSVDTDGDGVDDCNDNCPTYPNGPSLGTCTKIVATNWIVRHLTQDCLVDGDCLSDEFCEKSQADNYPPGGNGIGDACDCESDFICDGDVDADDVTAFLADFGREFYYLPCTNASPCNGDFDCDVDVDANDVTKFLEDFGREVYFDPCPSCTAGPWCTYP